MSNRIYAFGGLGGLICGIDFGIIAVALTYMRALELYSDKQIGWIVGGVMLGGMKGQVCIASRGKVKKLCTEVKAGASADVSIRALRGSGGL